MQLKEARFLEERTNLNKRLEDSVKEESLQYDRLQVTHALTKWKFIIQLMKAKSGGETLNLEEILAAIQKGPVGE